MAGGTVLKLGYTNPLTGVFGAHPQLGAVLDLDDAATFTLLSPDGLDLSAPARTVVLAGNIRSQGERATRAIYRENRAVSIPLLIGPMQSAAGLAATVRALAGWLDAPPAVPVTVQWQAPGATAPLYLDVVAAAHSLGSDERDWLRLQMEDVEIVLWVRPGLRGDRVTLSNLASNPGFEQGSGPGVVAFADPLANLNAYTQVSGSAPSLAPANTYVDIVQAVANGGSSLLRYFRLGESSGVVAPDVSGLGQSGTYQGAFTRGAAGAISGDTDTAITFAGAGDISVPVGSGPSALPTGASAWSIAAWVKIASNPASNAVVAAFGSAAAGQAAHVGIDTTGKPYASVFGTNVVALAAVSLNVYHLLVGTYDGTTLRIYVDNLAAVSGAATANIGASGARIAQQVDGTASISATIDEVAFYGAALSSGQIGTLFTAGSSGPTGTQGNAMSIPAGGEISFGSASWGPINTWQVRFRWDRAIVTARFRLHRVDGANDIEAQVTQTAVNLAHRVAGTAHTLAAVASSLSSGAWYWLQFTQYPAPPGDPPYLAASVYADDGGAIGALVASATAAAFDAVTALSGKPALQVDGAALVVGGTLGNATGAGQRVSLFGPGGWLFVGIVGTGVVSGAWEQNTANTAPLGTLDSGGAVVVPVTSFGAARMDLPPAGTFDGQWLTYNGGAPSGTSAIPAAVGQVFGLKCLVKSAGLDATASTRISVSEWDASGGFLTGASVGTITGNIASWTPINTTYTVQNASTAYIGITLRCSSSNAGSAGATVWFDNVQVWNQTLTGVANGAMPYCELRFPQSPATLIVSGLLGDLPAPAYIGLGTFVSSLAKGGSLAFALGRAGQASSSAAQLAAHAHGYYGSGGSPVATAVLDASAYGGYYPTALANSGWSPRGYSMSPSDAPGVYHLFTRIWTAQLLANLAGVTARANVQVRSQPWYGALDNSDVLWEAFGPFAAPFGSSSTWTVADIGQVTLPPAMYGGLVDPTQNVVSPRSQLVDNNGGGSQMRADWVALLPVDGSLLVGSFINPSNAVGAISAKWVWAHFDGLLVNRAGASDGPSWLYALETMPTANPAHAAGGPGNTGTGFPSVNSGADPYLTLDPGVGVAQTGQAGVNVLVGYIADASAGAVLPLHSEIRYDPLYLWPR